MFEEIYLFFKFKSLFNATENGMQMNVNILQNKKIQSKNMKSFLKIIVLRE